MTFSIETISTKRFLLISLLSIPMIVGLPILFAVQFDSGKFIILIPLLFIAIILIAKRFSRQLVKLDINTERLIINSKTIDLKSILGYHLNYSGISMSSIDLRLKTRETVSITCSNSGKRGKEFKRLTDYLIKTIEENNINAEQLNYQEVHVKQMIFLRPIIIIGAILVLGLDIYAIYLKLVGEKGLPWQIFFLNILVISLIPYLRRRKN